MAKKLPLLVIPKGTAMWDSQLVEPDDYEGTVKYKIKIVYDSVDDLQVPCRNPKYNCGGLSIIDAYEKIVEEYRADCVEKKTGKAKRDAAECPIKPIWKPEYDKDGNETGRVYVEVTQNAEVKGKDGRSFYKVVGADGRSPIGDVEVGKGSTVQCLVSVRPFGPFNGRIGLTLDPKVVHVTNLVEALGATDGLDMSDFAEEGDIDASGDY